MISSLTPEIIYEDKDIIVCHKPAGVPTQSSRIGTKDMVSILKNHLIKNTAKKTASHEPYLAVIHRLDQPVEGLLVFAKTPAAARELSHQLTTSGFGKYYRAQALGIFEHRHGRCWLVRLLQDSLPEFLRCVRKCLKPVHGNISQNQIW